ncbi:hypothetical protein PENANT_c012G05075 [Penicillium antarcticum]|uniref:Protein kinase domain-containing protein n=1 Tax=Penicillium antarcticum TaxID=416450 RepID=A0A1V6Q6D3_9EURO|nr:hypothetical protein PENANT_c012G05075 [Penicillium antarcticum]
MPHVDTLSERCFVDMLGAPEVGKVRRRDGKPVGPSLPEYIVRAASYQGWTPTQAVKIIDLGESFLNTKAPKTLHTPLPLRAPEVIFQYRVDYRVDLWSLGCMLFELFTGQPPFDTFMTTPTVLVRQMQDTASDFLPVKWQNSWAAMKEKDNNPRETPGPDLQEWLEDVYSGAQKQDLTREDITRLGMLIGKLLHFEPP